MSMVSMVSMVSMASIVSIVYSAQSNIIPRHRFRLLIDCTNIIPRHRLRLLPRQEATPRYVIHFEAHSGFLLESAPAYGVWWRGSR
jgi:hypothetical protein